MKLLSIVILFFAIGFSCKPRSSESEIRAGGRVDKTIGLDVNDVTILFANKGNGVFYPNIPIETVWPKSTFNDLIAFTLTGPNPPAFTTADNKPLFDPEVLPQPNQFNAKFGQFFVPTKYLGLVGNFINNGAQPDGTPESQVAKDLADEMVRSKSDVSCAKGAIFGNAPTICQDGESQPNYTHHRNAIAFYKNWRIVAMRLDLCASAHATADFTREQCEVEFRLIAQPYGDFAPKPPGANGVAPPLDTAVYDPANPQTQGPFMFDVSAHLLFKIGKLDTETGIISKDGNPTAYTAQDLVAALQEIKAASPVSTNGSPLGVHPGLKAEVANGSGNLGTAITNFINTYSKDSNNNNAMTNITSMHVAGPAVFDSSVWVFFQGGINGKRWIPTTITGGNNFWSVRTASVKGPKGKVFPPPEVLSNTTSINAIFNFNDSTPPAPATVLPPAIANLPAYFDNPGFYGDPTLHAALRRATSKNGDYKQAASVRNADCISCHMTATRSFEWGIRSIAANGAPQLNLYVPPLGTTAYLDAEVVPRIDYNLRNLGYSLPPPIQSPQAKGLAVFNFAGTRTETPAIMPRVVYESAELVNFINTKFIGVANPGFQCGAENVGNALTQSAVPTLFTDNTSSSILPQTRRPPNIHAALADCMLYESLLPGGSFGACAKKVCGQTVVLSPVVAQVAAKAVADAQSPTQPQPGTQGGACLGKLVLGACWYLGQDGVDCATTCGGLNPRQAYDERTNTIAGSAGTNQQCQQVLSAFTFTAVPSDTSTCTSGRGCLWNPNLNAAFRCTNPATAPAASGSANRRVCACN